MGTRSHEQTPAAPESSSRAPANPFKTRPFGPPPIAQTDPNELPAQQKPAPRFGRSIERIDFTPRPKPPMIHPKLTIGAPGDKYEQEADRVAQEVVQRLRLPQPIAPQLERGLPQPQAVQRETLPEDDELQMTPEEPQHQRVEHHAKDLPAQQKPVPRFGHRIERIDFTPRPKPPMIYPKLTIGAQGDTYEQEADHVAQQVVQRLRLPQPIAPQLERGLPQPQAVQRETLPDEDELQMKPLADQIQRVEHPEEVELQMKPELQRETDPEEEDELQMKPLALQRAPEGAMDASVDLEGAIAQARGSGSPLADTIREPMEQAFGADFSKVNVHTDSQSDQLNRSIQAKAFTTGQDIFFRQGAYQPNSQGGQELLAHELTHVVQQTGGMEHSQHKGASSAEGQAVSVYSSPSEQQTGLERPKALPLQGPKNATEAAVIEGEEKTAGPVEETRKVKRTPRMDVREEEDVLDKKASQGSAAQSNPNKAAKGSESATIVEPLEGKHRHPIMRTATDLARPGGTAADNNVVPDLPAAKVDMLTAGVASADPGERSNVLKDLLRYLLEDRQLFAGYESYDDGTATIDIDYAARGGGADEAKTEDNYEEGGESNETKITITVYPSAFVGGAASLYSTVRHELIHAAQRIMETDDQTDARDAHIHYHVRGNPDGLKQAWAERFMRVPMTEIEAYGWEIRNSAETGVRGEALAHVEDMLRTFVSKLCDGIESNAFNKKAFGYWAGYIAKTVSTLGQIKAAVGAATREEIERLSEAVLACERAG